MIWYTFLHGLALFTIGIVCRFVVQLQQWQALIPIVMGLGYITFAEGMRSKPTARRLFLFLAIIWSVVIVVVSLPFARGVIQAWQNQPIQMDGVAASPELVIEHCMVLILTVIYVLVAVWVLFRKPAQV
jgi:hypothetical protein